MIKSLSNVLKEKIDKKVVQFIQSTANDIVKNKNKYSEEDVKHRVKNIIQKACKCKDDAFQFNQNNVDLIVSSKGVPIAFIETKTVVSSEMPTEKDLNKKGLHEIISYFFDDLRRHLEKDGEEYTTVEWFVITNGIKWFIIPKSAFTVAVEYDDAVRSAVGIDAQLFNFKKTDIYKAIKEHYDKHPDKIDKILIYTADITNQKDAEALSILFGPEMLLGEKKQREKVALNKRFYEELLYIFGLEEKNKKILPIKNAKWTIYDQISRIDKDLTEEEKLELIVIWLNRILFLKLFEARLVAFNRNKKFAFMDTKHIPDFPSLNNLFFEVMAVKEDERFDDEFKDVPYLNSSLFEKTEIEKNHLFISSLANKKVDLYSRSVLGKEKFPLLEYLLKFLDAYNFGTTDNPVEAPMLISPAVLGLVFEKINGYKDGSYYTPSEITDYMAEDAIKKRIVLKVNEKCGSTYKDYNDLLNAVLMGRCKDEVKEAVDTLTVVDPAVGSGHFLVSALNVLLKIRWDLGIFNGDISLKTKYDIVKTAYDVFPQLKDGTPFIYKRPTEENDQQKFQELLFNEKRYIIEHNLFGADINPKAVEIARLRLWIELLKNAYYTKESNFTKMQTLPNIDINIKQGDSLLAPIVDVVTDLFSSGSENVIKRYKELFNEYQNTDNKERKKQIAGEIEQIRKDLLKTSVSTSYKDFVWTIDFPQILDDNGNFKGFDVVIGNPPYGVIYKKKTVEDYRSTGFNKHRGSTNSYILFVEKGMKLLYKNNAILSYIVPMSIIASDSADALHQFIKQHSHEMYVSSYSIRPKPVFASAVVDTSIISIIKKENPDIFKVFATKMYRSTGKEPLSVILKNLKFVDVTDFYRNGRYPKVSNFIEKNILRKIDTQKYKISNFIDKDNGIPIYYRTAGGMYFKIVTPYSTHSSAEKPLFIKKTLAQTIGAIMSSNLFFWYYQIFSDNLNLKFSDIASFGIPYDKLDNTTIALIEKAYDNYLRDIEKHVIVHNTTNYANIDSFKEYKIRLSKNFIDEIDKIICPLYGLTAEETNFIINYDIEFRNSDY